MMTRPYPGHELPQFRELTTKKWNQCTWDWRLTVPKMPKMTLVRRLTTTLGMTVRDARAASARGPLPAPLTPVSRGWGGRSGPLDRCPPPPQPQLPASEIRQTFLSTNLACLLAFEQLNWQTPFGDIIAMCQILYWVLILFMLTHWIFLITLWRRSLSPLHPVENGGTEKLSELLQATQE